MKSLQAFRRKNEGKKMAAPVARTSCPAPVTAPMAALRNLPIVTAPVAVSPKLLTRLPPARI
jgi:hypothetical protein